MAEYTRFEAYIPTYYTTSENDSQSGEPVEAVHMVDPRMIRRFVDDTLTVYQGITQSNPAATAPFKGWWQPRAGAPVTVDHLIYVFGLVTMTQFDEALEHFATWKRTLEEAIHQDIILIMYYPVQTIGDFL